jgi:hypothetical protein
MQSRNWSIFYIHIRSVYILAFCQIIIFGATLSVLIGMFYLVYSHLILWICAWILAFYGIFARHSPIRKAVMQSGRTRVLFTSDELLYETYNIFTGYNLTYICTLPEITHIYVFNNQSSSKILGFVVQNGHFRSIFNIRIESKIYLKYITEYLTKHHNLVVHYKQNPNTFEPI